MTTLRPQSAGPGGRSLNNGRYSAFPNAQQLTKMSQNRTAPKWSFGGRHGGAMGRPGTPGPGSYSGDVTRTASKHRQPAYGFGTAIRDERRAEHHGSPGPGQYAPKTRPRSATPTYRFGSGQRGNERSGFNMTPGPGSYVPNYDSTRHTTPAYTATPRRDAHAGRGAYVCPSSPGPGAYEAPFPLDKSKSPEYGFGLSFRDKPVASSQWSPGPGAYNVDNMGAVHHENPAYSIRARTETGYNAFSGHGGQGGPGGHDGAHSDTPGPGAFAGMYTQFGY